MLISLFGAKTASQSQAQHHACMKMTEKPVKMDEHLMKILHSCKPVLINCTFHYLLPI